MQQCGERVSAVAHSVASSKLIDGAHISNVQHGRVACSCVCLSTPIFASTRRLLCTTGTVLVVWKEKCLHYGCVENGALRNNGEQFIGKLVGKRTLQVVISVLSGSALERKRAVEVAVEVVEAVDRLAALLSTCATSGKESPLR